MQLLRETQPFEVERDDREAHAFYPGHREILPYRHVSQPCSNRQRQRSYAPGRGGFQFRPQQA